jgi:hypothetical protein
MTGPDETHKVTLAVKGPKNPDQTVEFMTALRAFLGKYGVTVYRQEVLKHDKSKGPDPS